MRILKTTLRGGGGNLFIGCNVGWKTYVLQGEGTISNTN